MTDERIFDGIEYRVGERVVVTGPVIWDEAETKESVPLGTPGTVFRIKTPAEDSPVGAVSVQFDGYSRFWMQPGFNIKLLNPPVRPHFLFSKRKITL
jgi:hypothetical protein